MINTKLLFKLLQNSFLRKKKILSTYDRKAYILPPFIGQKIAVHNGNTLKIRTIRSNMLFYKLGEFSNTRTTPLFKQKKAKRK